MNIDGKTPANLTSEQVLEIVKQEEQIHQSPSWIWKSVIGFSLAGFSLFSLFIIGHENKGLIKNDVWAVSICALAALSFTIFSLYKLSIRGFSIRLNHFGMMITNYSKQKWYPWNAINQINTLLNHGTKTTVMKVKFDFHIDKNSNSESLVLPENHEKSPHAMVKQMRYFKQQYEILELYKFPELENHAKQNPVTKIDILWGRLGANKKP